MALDVVADAWLEEPRAGRPVGEGVQRRLSVLNRPRTEEESAAPAARLDKVERLVSDVAAVTEEGSAKPSCPEMDAATRALPLLL